jgi:transcriptional regulator with XRE-family HTH domain
MVYALEDIARTLKVAREAKRLSQRALSAKVGLTQAHISNIENAASDLHISNLMQLARALDFEVMIVPRKAVPAVQGLIRNIGAANPVPPPPSKTVRSLERSFEKLVALHSVAKEVSELRNIVSNFRSFNLDKEQLHAVDSVAKDLRRVAEALLKEGPTPSEIQRLTQITNRLRAIRNAVVHSVPTADLNRVLRAYELDDGESDG